MKNWKDFKTDSDLRKNYIGISTDELWEIFLDVKEEGLCDDIDIAYVSKPVSGATLRGVSQEHLDRLIRHKVSNNDTKMIEISFSFHDLFDTPYEVTLRNKTKEIVDRDRKSDRFKNFESKLIHSRYRLHRLGYKMEFYKIGYGGVVYLISRIKEVE